MVIAAKRGTFPDMLGDAPAENGGGGGGGAGRDGDSMGESLSTDVLTNNDTGRGKVVPDNGCRGIEAVGVICVALESIVVEDDGWTMDETVACC